jgi:signal transduction histidine kinase
MVAPDKRGKRITMTKPLILVVEDDLALLEGIRELLELTEYRVLIAANGREALEVLEKQHPDLIVSDIMMPEMDGYEFHAKVSEQPELSAIPFIFLTARGEKADIRRGKELGADDYITKPFDDEDLLVAVRAKLNRWENLRQQRDEEVADLKSKILLTLSHEFRTPLTYIINYSDLLEIEGKEIAGEDFPNFMQGIRRGALRLNSLVDDFLILVEIETGEAEGAYRYRRRRIEETGLWLRVITKPFQTAAEERELTLVTDIPEDLPPLVADEAYLSDAIGRLLDNAIKFSTDESEWVRFSAETDDDRLILRIQDQGQGIKEQDMGGLFDVFYQIDRAKREQQGSGSGLAICKGIIGIHGGEVGVESEFGKGSTFWVSLPFEPPDSQGESTESA